MYVCAGGSGCGCLCVCMHVFERILSGVCDWAVGICDGFGGKGLGIAVLAVLILGKFQKDPTPHPSLSVRPVRYRQMHRNRESTV